MARILDGQAAAEAFLEETAAGVATFSSHCGRPPGLAALLVGDDPASAVYVRMKARRCERAGIHSEVHRLGAEATTEQVLGVVAQLNERADIDGILVQMPLPPQVDRRRVIAAVTAEKDVDGFHPTNVGRLVGGDPRALVASTPLGIIRLLEREGIAIAGRRAVVLGRSDIVGKPMAMLLMHRHATVTVCHSRTRELVSVAREAEIVVAALGRPWMIGAAHVRTGAVVVDVGMSRVEADGFPGGSVPADSRWQADIESKGYTLLGDVNPLEVEPIAGALTPVPGGVGPLTIAMLLENTLRAARLRLGLDATSGA